MKPESYRSICDYVKRVSGIHLGEDKRYLLDSRLAPIVRERGLRDLDALASEVSAGRNASVLKEVVNALTTNETSFFRDGRPFECLRADIVPEIVRQNAAARRLRVWSAASSTGQEAYSVAITLHEMRASMPDWRVEIVGTDICSEVVARARAGEFSQFEVQRGLPIQHLVRYFDKRGQDAWKVKPEIAAMVRFEEGNLVTDRMPPGGFDVVFCRNVLIYFDQATKKTVVDGLVRALAPGGFLVVGSAETIMGMADGLSPLPGRHGVHRKAA